MEISRRAVMASGAAALALAPGLARGATDANALHKRLICLDTHLDMPANLARPGWNVMETPQCRRGFHPGRLSPHGRRRIGWRLLRHLHAAGAGDARRHERDARRGISARRGNPRDGGGTSRQVRTRLPGRGRQAHRAPRARSSSISRSRIPASWAMTSPCCAAFTNSACGLAGPIHFLNNQFGDSATDKPQWDGLSPLGKEFVKEANDLGVVLDASHSSDDVFDQMMELSRSPDHLLAFQLPRLNDHPRNLDDARIKKLAAAGGTIQMNSVYLITRRPHPERAKAEAAIGAKLENLGDMTPAQATAAVPSGRGRHQGAGQEISGDARDAGRLHEAYPPCSRPGGTGPCRHRRRLGWRWRRRRA